MDAKQSNNLRVLMFPWLAHGHISPFLELAKRLTHRNFHIHFCSTPINLSSIKQKLPKQYSNSIQFTEHHLPNVPDLPPHHHTTKNLPHHLNPTLKKTFDLSQPSFSYILTTLKPDLLIYDALQPWAAAIASEQGIPAVEFLTTGAATSSFLLHRLEYPDDDFPFPAIYLRDYEDEKITQFLESSENQYKNRERSLESTERSTSIVLIKTFRELEGKYIDYLSVLSEKKIVPVGPLVEENCKEEEGSEIINWLDKKEELSTVFVSFGSELFLSDEEIEELAYGLELSNVNFIWVLRISSNSVDEALPSGYLQRVGDRGMVVKGWAPQEMILRHRSVGGFVSHCGWSSVMEAVKNAVPVIAMPFQADEPVNARLLEELGVAVEVVRKRNGAIRREKVAEAVKEVVVGKRGEELRRKSRGLSNRLTMKGEEVVEAAADDLLQLCYGRSKLSTGYGVGCNSLGFEDGFSCE